MDRAGGGRRRYGREGFGTGRYGRGAGRTAARGNVWERVNRTENQSENQEQTPQEEKVEFEKGKEELKSGDWDKHVEVEKPDQENWGKGGKVPEIGTSQGNKSGPIPNPGVNPLRVAQGGAGRTQCEICGMSNQLTKDCRRQFYESCGFGNHNTFNCARVAWNSGPELCATQVEDQSFFFIPERIDPKVSKDKESTVVITIVEGKASGRQIETELASVHGSDTWKWKARQVEDKKFIVRFPNPKMLSQWCHFKYLPMDCAEARMKVESWDSSLGAVGRLQEVWFRVHGIPADQRAIRTIAQVGCLVGKTMEIDLSSRFDNDYVRIKIACLDVAKVPSTARCNLGMNIHIFVFEREVEVEETGRALKSGIVVGNSNQPSPKRSKPNESYDDKSGTPSGGKSASKFARAGAGYQQNNQSQSDMITKSAPAKFSADAQKMIRKQSIEMENEKVYIPKTISESEDSETMSDKLRKIGMSQDNGQGCSKDVTQHLWMFGSHVMNIDKQLNTTWSAAEFVKETCKVSGAINEEGTFLQGCGVGSPESFMPDDQIVNTQGSVNDEEKEVDEQMVKKMPIVHELIDPPPESFIIDENIRGMRKVERKKLLPKW